MSKETLYPSKPFKHVIKSQQFDPTWLIQEFFPETQAMESWLKLRRKGVESIENKDTTLKGKHICILFYEPSTRTRLSFEQAINVLGGQKASTENAKEFSSASKGESLKDTIRVLNEYEFDAIVMRHYQEGSAEEATSVSTFSSIINAGDGRGQHPTQALLDVYTIYQQFEKLTDLRISLVGDLKNGRTTRSLAYLMSKFKGVSFDLVAPHELQMNQDMLDYFNAHDVPYRIMNDLSKCAHDSDVIYLTRAQKERMSQETIINGDSVRMTPEIIDKMKGEGIIMHPLPRNAEFNELPEELTDNPRVVIFKQAKNGLTTRMALLKMLLT